MEHMDGKIIDILLIEDNQGDIDLAREALEDSKMRNRLFIAKDGEIALDMLFKRDPYEQMVTPDLIILDLNLPKVDGREVLQRLKEDELLKRIPVVILTTSKAEEDIIKTYNLHANCYITKPIDFNQFIRVVRSIEDFWLSIVILPSARS